MESRFKLLTFVRTMLPMFGALGLQLLAFTITARWLGVEQFGHYTAVLAVAAIGVDLVGLGDIDLLARAVAGVRSKFPHYFGHMMAMMALTWPAVILLGTALIIGPMTLALPAYLVAAALAAEILMGRAFATLEMMMVAHTDAERAGWTRLAAALVRLSAATCYFVIAGEHGLRGWIFTLCITSLLVAVASYQTARHYYGKPKTWLARAELGAGIVFCLTRVASGMQNNIDRIVLSRFASPADVGTYGAATRVLQIGLFPLQVATRITYPRFFAPEHRGLANGRILAMKLTVPMLAIGIVSALGVAAASLLIPALLGAQFQNSIRASMVLALAIPFIAIQTPPADALVAANRHSMRAIMYGGASVSIGFVLLIGAKLAGSLGLAAAFVVAQAMLAAALWCAAHFCTDGTVPLHLDQPIAPHPE